MPQIDVSDEVHRRLMALKNHWSFSYRNITNPAVIEKLNSLKKEIFGYDSTSAPEEIKRKTIGKTRDQLESESRRFQESYKNLLESGFDFEPEYKIDEHLKKMISLIEDSEDVGTPIF
jgi:predicted CopG family antitoxin